jgi:hypothetical protein
MRLRVKWREIGLRLGQNCVILPFAQAITGSSAARLARIVRDDEAGGSNPLSPILVVPLQERAARLFLFYSYAPRASSIELKTWAGGAASYKSWEESTGGTTA